MNATTDYEVFLRKLNDKGYSIEEDVVEALDTPYRVVLSDDKKVLVLNPVWTGSYWEYEHDVGRKFIHGESFVRMVPNKMQTGTSYLDREIEEG